MPDVEIPPAPAQLDTATRTFAQARDSAAAWLLERQDPAGWWTAELETNATMTAEHVLLLRFLGVPVDRIRDGAMRHLLGCQREDGSWALYADGPADLSTTAESYAALRVLGLDAADPRMRRARRVVLEQGGLARARVFTKIWFALFGCYPWDGVPRMPPELVHLPSWAPLNLYNFASWARGTIAPLLIVLSRRPVRDLGTTLDELVVPGTERDLHRVEGHGVFAWLDRLQRLYEAFPRQPGRDRSRRRIVDGVVERQEADGGWGGIQPPWVYSLIALHLEGMPLDHEVMRRGVAGLDGFALDDAGGWRLQACMSPVWDTALAVLALRDAGIDASHPQLVRAREWLLDQQLATGGDWQVRCRDARDCGGWAFEFANVHYPDVDDTAVVVLALQRGERTPRVARAVARAVGWISAMRSSDGGWAAFDRDNTDELAYRIPFADFGAMIDPPTEDVTAHAVEMFAAVGRGPRDPMVEPALQRLRGWQRDDGSWYGRWGVNFVYGTWCAVSALRAQGCDDAAVQRAAAWLRRVQRRDGGFGETCHSYVDQSFAGAGTPTPSQTAWGGFALLRAGELGDAAATAAGLRAAEWLVAAQRDGTWDEPAFTGTGFPRDFYINYHLYRHVFPLSALALAARHQAV